MSIEPRKGVANLTMAGLVWLDSGKPLEESEFAPLRERKDHETSSYLPTIQHKSRAALHDDDLDKFIQIDRQSSPSQPPKSDRPLQSACLLPFQYGASLNRDLMRIDALYAFSELFAFAAFSENQFINFVEKQVTDTVRAFRGQEQWSIATLKYSKDLLEDHVQHIQSTLNCLENEDKSNMPRAKEVADCEARNMVLEFLLDDFKYLLLRTQNIATRAKEGTETIMNDILLKDSRQSINQAREVGRLSLLAYFFLPMSFVTSVFGMNSVEISDWRWSVGAILIVFFSVMVLSLMLGFWGAMPWNSRKSGGRKVVER